MSRGGHKIIRRSVECLYALAFVKDGAQDLSLDDVVEANERIGRLDKFFLCGFLRQRVPFALQITSSVWMIIFCYVALEWE